jgi:hypothetical protein
MDLQAVAVKWLGLVELAADSEQDSEVVDVG